MVSAIHDANAFDTDQLLAESLLQYNSGIDNNTQTIGLPTSPDSATSIPTTVPVDEVNIPNHPTATQPYETDALRTDANDVFSNDTISPPLPPLTDDCLDEISDDDDDNVIQVNEYGTEASRNTPARKRKKHAPMTEEQ